MNKMKIETHEDGWDCVPQLQQAVEELDAINNFNYEIKYGVRASTLNHMVYEMKEILNYTLNKLEEIDTEVEYKTVEDND